MTRRRPPPRSPRAARGFTLIEMVAAFLVFAIGVGVLMETLGASMRNVTLSGDYTGAALRAQSRLDALGVSEELHEGAESGKFDDTYHWELDVRKIEPSTIQPSPTGAVGNTGADGGFGQVSTTEVAEIELYRVALTVYWGTRGRERHAQFTTLRAIAPDQARASLRRGV